MGHRCSGTTCGPLVCRGSQNLLWQRATGLHLENRFVIVASKVLNKFEKSLLAISDGLIRVNYTRRLLFEENKADCKASFQESTGIPVKDIRYQLNVEADKSLCTIVC